MKRRIQDVASMQRGGGLLSENVGKVLKPVGLKRYVAGGEYLDTLANTLKKSAEILEEKNDIEEQNNMLETDNVLKNYRQRLQESNSLEEFDEIAKSIDVGVKEHFNSSSAGKSFFEKHGNSILELNKKDVVKLRELKEYEIGKKSLDMMLANSQNILTEANGSKADTLIERGVERINQTCFLDENQRDEYRRNFLKNGVLSLALSDGKKAREEAVKYQGDVGDDIFEKIDEIEKIKLKEQENLKIQNKRKDYVGRFGEAVNLWQMKERGEIGEAEFKVLAMEHDDYLWGENKDNKNYDEDLSNAYKIVRKLNNGDEYEVEELNNLSNFLMKAYRNKKISFDEVANFQNQLLAMESDRKTKERLFDSGVDEFLDNVMGGDSFGGKVEEKISMEEKAKIAFQLYDAYWGKKLALSESFLMQGGSLTPKVERVFKRRALDEIKNEFGYKENIGGKFGVRELKTVLNQIYNGSQKEDIWKEFYKLAPFAEDKVSLLKNIAKRQSNLEMYYPRFDSWAEVLDADLAQGDIFYFKGRLAKKA